MDEVAAAARDVWLDLLGREAAGESSDFEGTCARLPELAAELCRLRSRHAIATDPVPLPAPVDVAELLQRLGSPRLAAERYRVGELIARGGMGEIRRGWDNELRRAVALKFFRASGAPRAALTRFIEEAQIAGQLDHPGIVPVHDVGVDAQGRAYFAMKLVAGRDLRAILTNVHAGRDGWSRPRVLGVLLKVCDALAYAHTKGVVHRDLKPANVMVGRFGEVFVMDWGIARIERASTMGDEAALVRTLRSERIDAEGATLHGDVIGTAAYMAPEQALGDPTLIGRAVDVYAIGALLYEILARTPPYGDAHESSDSADIVRRLRAGPPRALREVAGDAEPELIAICERAMRREPPERYPSVQALAEDLRAYLEGRVVRAHDSGRRRRLVKWIARNRALASAAGAALTLLVIAGGATWWAQRSQSNLQLLARLRAPAELAVEYEFLWPPGPDKLEAQRRWLELAQTSVARRAAVEAEIEQLRARSLPFDPNAPRDRKAREQLLLSRRRARELSAHFESDLASGVAVNWEGTPREDMRGLRDEFAAMVATYDKWLAETPRATWRFADSTDELLHDRLSENLAQIDALAQPALGAPSIAHVRRALEESPRVVERSLVDARESWAEACASIGDVARCPRYAGLQMRAQLGLIPLGRDSASGLWEFAHIWSGATPQRDANGQRTPREEDALVLVLIPAAATHMGSQALDPALPNFDPHTALGEGPVMPLRLDAFFLSKYELTQAQWRRMSGATGTTDGLLPQCQINWRAATAVLREVGLSLPTEAQWEYAARSNSGAPAVIEVVSLGSERRLQRERVGSLPAGALGLHDMQGNVREWCLDRGITEYGADVYLGTGQRQEILDGARAARGVSYLDALASARPAARFQLGEYHMSPIVGVRAARALDP